MGKPSDKVCPTSEKIRKLYKIQKKKEMFDGKRGGDPEGKGGFLRKGGLINAWRRKLVERFQEGTLLGGEENRSSDHQSLIRWGSVIGTLKGAWPGEKPSPR